MTKHPFQLVMKTGPNPGKVYALTQSEIHLGRDISNDIVINDAEVSRKHARLLFQSDQYFLEDMGSTNGTFMNSVRIGSPHPLQPGQSFQLGEHVIFIFESTSYDPDATVAAGQEQVQRISSPSPRRAPKPMATPYTEGQQEPTYTGKQAVLGNNNRFLIFAGIGCLLLFVCVVVPGLFLWWIDAQELWCDLLPFLSGCAIP